MPMRAAGERWFDWPNAHPSLPGKSAVSETARWEEERATRFHRRVRSPKGQSTQHDIIFNENGRRPEAITEIDMLCITLKCGEYFTVGNDTVVQYDKLSGDRIHLTIQAPREVPILRGEVLERNGGKRPDCVYGTCRQDEQ